MDREELTKLIAQGPVRIRMNDGNSVVVPNSEMATVSDMSAAVLVRSEDGRLRHQHLALLCICSVEPISNSAGA
jgi:hypothetical protein